MKFLVALGVVCALAVLASVQLAPADSGQPTAKVSKAGGKRGPRGRRGPRGPKGPPGIANIVEVDGAELSLSPGQFGGAPLASCPPGAEVVGTGFNGPFNVVGGFVKAYGTFVGGFFANESSITLTGSVEAICAEVGGAGASTSAAEINAFHRDVAEAERLAAR